MFDFFDKLIIILLLIINTHLVIKKNKICEHNNIINKEKILKENKNNIYKDLLKLYIENKEMFYKKGREYILGKRGEIYNESHLVTFQDKINYLLIHESPENKTNIVDKILLRNYTKKILGKDICPQILKIYKDIDEINLDELPEKFVLKCNHGSGMNIVCDDKTKFNLARAKHVLKKWMNINYGLWQFEYQYLNIEKRIFAEKFLVNEMINYKFYCFNGIPKLIRVKGNINGTNIYNMYYTNWTISNIEFDFTNYVKDSKNIFKKPINFEKMLYYAKLLSAEFCFCRVDYYEVDGLLYLSELTFSPFNAYIKYKKKEMEIYLGSLINISKIEST